MKQNKYFSFRRFVNLFRNNWLINQKTYYFSLAGLSLAIYVLAYLSMYFGQNFNNDNYSVLFASYLLGIGVFIGTAFPVLNNQIKTSSYLLAPGSTLEKCLIQFLIRFVLFIPIAIMIFWICMYLAKASLIANPYIQFDARAQILDFHFNKLFEVDWKQNTFIYLSVFSIYTILFAGATYFNRFALVKTLIVSAIILGAVLLLFVFFSHIFFPAQTNGFEIELHSYEILGQLYNIQLFFYLLSGLSWLFFLSLAYFKLKEKEV